MVRNVRQDIPSNTRSLHSDASDYPASLSRITVAITPISIVHVFGFVIVLVAVAASSGQVQRLRYHSNSVLHPSNVTSLISIYQKIILECKSFKLPIKVHSVVPHPWLSS
jgi:hypothetical protein